MRILIVGASGQVGSNLWQLFSTRGYHTVVGTYFQHSYLGLRQLDMTDEQGTRSIFQEVQPEWTLLPAAQCHVDWCEDHEDESWRINVLAVEQIASLAQSLGSFLVFYSSDHVFSGLDRDIYTEEDPSSPLSIYARHKVEAEQRIRQLLPDRHLIIRSGWVYGPELQGKNFVIRTVQRLRQGEKVIVASDQYGSPTYAEDLARATEAMLTPGLTGTYHAVGPEWMSRHRFAELIAQAYGLPVHSIRAAPTDQLQQRAPRSLRIRLSTKKIERDLPLKFRNPREGLEHLKALQAFA